MKLKTLNRITDWINQYQPSLTKEEWKILYDKLVYEEVNETREAYKDRDLIEYLDWLWDTLWVKVWEQYFDNDDIWIYAMDIDSIDYQISTTLKYKWVTSNIIDELINEIADSNFSKSYELQGEGEKVGKVIKWPNFKKPNIQRIVDKYKIEWK